VFPHLHPEVDNKLLCSADIEGELVVLPVHSHPYRLTQAYNRGVVSKLDDGGGVATQSWVNREYSRGVRTHPWGAPVLRVWRICCCQSLQPVVFLSGSPGSSCRGWCSDAGL
jgi:hypothetical protein